MADTSNLTSFLTDVADAIRTKKEITGTILAQNFDTEISSITSGGTDTSDATAVASDISINRSAYANDEKINRNIDICKF